MGMDIVEAVRKRKSIRAFKPDPVPQSILKEIMESALWAPSWANTQPWEFAIVAGGKLEAIRQGFLEKAEEESIPDIARPQEYPEPYNSRRGGLARLELEKLGIKREDRQGRGWWRLQNLRLYGAPSAIYIYVDRSFFLQSQGINVWSVFDCGLVAQNIMLLATAHGLGTVTQAMAVAYPEVIKKVLGIPDSKLMVVGIAIGYPDWDEAITQIRSEREPLGIVARWYGFE